MINGRMLKIIHYLYSNKDTTYKDISKDLDIKERLIRYDIEKIKALNTYENPLDKLYKEWFKSDIGIHTLFEDSIYDTLSDIVKEQKEKKKSRER